MKFAHMKRFLIISFTILFTAMSVGMVRYEHHCRGVLKSISLQDTQFEGEKCPKCNIPKGNNNTKNCCKHHSQLIKVTEKAQKTTQLDFSSKILHGILPEPVTFNNEYLPSVPQHTTNSIQTVKTFTAKNPLYIINCVFRI